MPRRSILSARQRAARFDLPTDSTCPRTKPPCCAITRVKGGEKMYRVGGSTGVFGLS